LSLFPLDVLEKPPRHPPNQRVIAPENRLLLSAALLMDADACGLGAFVGASAAAIELAVAFDGFAG